MINIFFYRSILISEISKGIYREKGGDIGRLDLARQFIKYIFQIRKWMLPNVFHDFLIQISITCFRKTLHYKL